MTVRTILRGTAAFSLAAVFGLGTAIAPASAQMTEPAQDPAITQGVTPQDQSGGVPPQTLPDDDTVFPEDVARDAATDARQIVVLPDGQRVDATEGQFLTLDDGSQIWEWGGQQYPVTSGFPGAPSQPGVAPGDPSLPTQQAQDGFVPPEGDADTAGIASEADDDLN